MEIHQSLPAQYLHNPYLVKTEPIQQQQQQQQHQIPQQTTLVVAVTSAQQSTSSGGSSETLTPPPPTSTNQHATHTVVSTNSNGRSSNNNNNNNAIRRHQSSNGPDYHRLYGHEISTAAVAASSSTTHIAHSASSNIHQNGRPLTADRKRPYNCNMCSSRFGSKMELEEHQNSHTGQKPFECNMCKARFNRRSTLWNHKRIHSDDKPFECNVCRMTFKWKNSLKCHKEMHQRKNEMTGIENDPLEKTLTYATAAKRRHLENHGTVRASSSSEAGIVTGTAGASGLITTTNSSTSSHSSGSVTRRRTAKLSLHTMRSMPSTSSTADLIIGGGSSTTINNNNNSGSISSSHSLTASSDAFIHTPLQADGFFSSQKALSISDHKELDSLLNSTSRLTSMLKDDPVFKSNLCDDLASLGNQSSAFDTKQEMNLFHPNPFMMFGAHQLQNSVQSFAPSNLAFSSSNGTAGCGDYFHLHLNNQTDHPMATQSQQHQQQQLGSSQYSTEGTPTQSATNMLMSHNHNVITYQTQLDAPSSLLAPALDYTVTGNNLEYMLNSYTSTISSATGVASTGNELRPSPEHLQQRQQYAAQNTAAGTNNNLGTDGTNVVANAATGSADPGKEVPQVSW